MAFFNWRAILELTKNATRLSDFKSAGPFFSWREVLPKWLMPTTTPYAHRGVRACESLGHCDIIEAGVGTRLPPRVNFWNRLLLAVIGVAAKTLPKDQVAALVTCGFVTGKRKAGGFHYISEADISVQAQNANTALRATYHILKTTRMSAEIESTWQIGWKRGLGDAAPAKMVVDRSV
jgi:hypothetical protein